MKIFSVLSFSILALLLSTCDEAPKETWGSPIMYSKGFIGWDCPDNLKFPRVDLKDWYKVPVVNGRLPTLEETQNGTSLLFINIEMKPDIKDVQPFKMTLPKLAYFNNPTTHKKELVIVIQLVQFSDYVWAGLRYVSGGNASAIMSDLHFLTDDEIKLEIEKSAKVNSLGVLNKPSGY